MPTSFSDGVADPWFTQNSMATYVPTGPQGNRDGSSVAYYFDLLFPAPLRYMNHKSSGTFGLFGRPVPNTQLTYVPVLLF